MAATTNCKGSSPTKDQFSGCLIGQCLGDAAGAPVEGLPPDQCRYYVEKFLRVLLTGSIGRGRHPFGQYTDDSQLARELMESYVVCGGFDPAEYGGRIAAIFSEGRIVGGGRTTRAAAERLTAGVAWEEAGAPPPTAGNGSAMRAGPIGLFFHDDPAAMVRAAHDQGRITHRDPRCSAGAVTIAGAVALALQSAPIDPGAFLAQLAVWSEPYDLSSARYLRRLEEWLDLPQDDALAFIAVAGADAEVATGWQGISPFVTGSVLWSLYAFLRNPGDYWETICNAISGGGDTDTTAAMAGAISGAHLGLDAIPRGLADCLQDQHTWGFAELVELAEACYHFKEGKER